MGASRRADSREICVAEARLDARRKPPTFDIIFYSSLLAAGILNVKFVVERNSRTDRGGFDCVRLARNLCEVREQSTPQARDLYDSTVTRATFNISVRW